MKNRRAETDQNDQNPQQPLESLSAKEQCYMLLHDMVYILAFVTILFVFALRVVSVNGWSMYPTLMHQDYVALLSNVLYSDDSIKNGDVVVALAPEFDDEPLVKRVIATEGQTVDIDFQRGIVYVDGVALQEDYINAPTTTQFYRDGVKFPLVVEEGHVFLLGDNRNESSDSRLATIGQVDVDYVLGKVVCILLPGADRYTEVKDFERIGNID